MAPNRVREELNTAQFGWFHIKAILVAGIGLFSDAYDLICISIAKQALGIVYCVALVGTALGQVVFGILGDYMGRKKVYLLTLVIMITAIIGQCFAASMVKGIGRLPLVCQIASEYSSSKWRGAFVASVFAMQGLGILVAAIVSMMTVWCLKNTIINNDINFLDYVWRIIIGFGAVPTVLTIYLRSQLPETPRFSQDVEKDEAKALKNTIAVKANEGGFIEDYAAAAKMDQISAKSLHSYLTFPSILRNRNFWVLLGTASTWFLLDIAFYSQNLFLPNILEGIAYNPSIHLPAAKCGKDGTHCPVYDYPIPPFGPEFKCTGQCAEQVYDKMWKTAAGNAITACMGAVPGYWFTVAFVDSMGRVNIQYMGFTIMTVILVVLAAAINQIISVNIWLFIVLYALTFFFANFGPNATTFITPVELFNTKYPLNLAWHLCGHWFVLVSTATITPKQGKLGAIVGAFGFGQLFLTAGISTTLAILAAVNFLGLCCTIFVPETKKMHLEDAALYSESHFQKMLKTCGVQQVNPAIEEYEAEHAAALPVPSKVEIVEV
ncbi:g10534 [Coccomyxa elongata]